MELGVIGVVLMALAAAMVFVARPRHGEVVGFLRRSANFQSAYTLLLITLFVLGIMLAVAGVGG